MAVSEGLSLGWLALAELERDEQKGLVGRVGERVRGLCEQRGRPAEQPARELRHRDGRVGGQRDEDRLATRPDVAG
jgi:hypothetical protein